MSSAWMVRGGRDGEREAAALTEGLVVAGWEEMGDLTQVQTRQDLRDRLIAAYPDASRATIGNWTGQLWRMIMEMAVGDLVVLPLKTHPSCLAIGRISSDYYFRAEASPGFRHVRGVEWLRKDVSRGTVRQDLLDSLGSLLTICRLERFDAAERIAHLASGGEDPGPRGGEHDIRTTRDLAARAAAATSDEPFRLSIRNLLSCWGVVRRSPSAVAQIEADLVNLGLTTRPPFTEGWIDNLVEVVAVGEEPSESTTSSSTQRTSDVDEADDATDFPPITLRINVLSSANTGIAFVGLDDDVQLAVTRMIASNFSQLAVLTDLGELAGAISWESIGKAQIAGPVGKVSSVMTVARAVGGHEDLLSQIDEIYRSGYVFVRSENQRISGIVTAADLTAQFGELARPLVLIEEAERRLQRRVDEVFTSEEIKVFTNKKAHSAAGMTIGNYRHALAKPENWARLCWSLDHGLFVEYLEQVRKTRNEFMHFSPDPLNEDQVSWLEGFVRILRVVDPRA